MGNYIKDTYVSVYIVNLREMFDEEQDIYMALVHPTDGF